MPSLRTLICAHQDAAAHIKAIGMTKRTTNIQFGGALALADAERAQLDRHQTHVRLLYGLLYAEMPTAREPTDAELAEVLGG